MEEDIKEILTALDNTTKKQLDEAIANADKEWSEMELEEDIKILEEIKKKFERSMKIIVLGEYSTYVDNSIFEDIKKLINISENLIARYKELEVLNKMQEYRISVIDERELMPKSKVQEKIEEYKQKMEKDVNYLSKDYFNYRHKIYALQELLED